MPAIFPFRALRYSDQIKSLDRVVCPPYDIISPQGQDALYKKSTCNFIRVIYGKTRKSDKPGQDRYSRARALFSDWFKQGLFRLDARPALYPYRQRFILKGRTFDRWGALALIRLGESTIFPHENTYAGPKQDRLQLITAVQANLSPIFGLVDDSDHHYRVLLSRVESQKPLMSVDYEGVRHEVWRVTQPQAIAKLQAAIETKAMLIADGHHRYEVAVQYRDILKKRSSTQFHSSHPANFMLIDVAGFDGEDPGIMPTHRVFDGLESLRFEQLKKVSGPGLSFEPVSNEAEMLRRVAQASDQGAIALGCYTQSEGYGVVIQELPLPEGMQLDVELLHLNLVPQHLAPTETERQKLRITYTHEWTQAVEWVNKGQGKLAWYTQAPTFEQILQCVRQGKRLPQKSTYFVPKPLSGLVIHRLRLAGTRTGDSVQAAEPAICMER